MTDEKELGKALNEDKDTIEIEGNLAAKVIRIKATGKVSWAVAIGAIAVAILAIVLIPTSGGVSAPVSVLTATPSFVVASSVLGTQAAVSAVSIAVAGGGVGTLKKLRKYKLEKIDNNKIILKRQ